MADWTNRATCVLFGDARGGRRSSQAAEIACFSGCTRPPIPRSFTDTTQPATVLTTKAAACYEPMPMNGQEVYKFAVSSATENIRALCSPPGSTLSDIDHFVLHQANLRILEAVRTRLHQPVEKFPHNLEHYGNTSSASVPLLLDELNRAGSPYTRRKNRHERVRRRPYDRRLPVYLVNAALRETSVKRRPRAVQKLFPL